MQNYTPTEQALLQRGSHMDYIPDMSNVSDQSQDLSGRNKRQSAVYGQFPFDDEENDTPVVVQTRDCGETIKTKNILTVLLAVLLIISLGSTIYYAIATSDSSLGTFAKIALSTGSVLVTVAAFATATVLFWRHRDRVACSTRSPKVKSV